jgi:hypothetical protein
MCDGAARHPFLPTFCFQKTGLMQQILLPDIDFLHYDFYSDGELNDTVDYKRKTDTAIFVGATTGATITEDMATSLSIPRLDAARYFATSPNVSFLLPSIVQCESEQAREVLASKSFCQGDKVSWPDQFKHKFLLSIDGNGATCSRVVVAMKSNSILMKYNSPWKLYYFDYIKPFIHYLPISDHGDVGALIDRERRSPGYWSGVSSAAGEFAHRFLGRDEVEFYMASLLIIYDYCFSSSQNRADCERYTKNDLFNELLRKTVAAQKRR